MVEKIQILAEKDPAKLPWKDLEVDYVVESAGFLPIKADAQKQFKLVQSV